MVFFSEKHQVQFNSSTESLVGRTKENFTPRQSCKKVHRQQVSSSVISYSVMKSISSSTSKSISASACQKTPQLYPMPPSTNDGVTVIPASPISSRVQKSLHEEASILCNTINYIIGEGAEDGMTMMILTIRSYCLHTMILGFNFLKNVVPKFEVFAVGILNH